MSQNDPKINPATGYVHDDSQLEETPTPAEVSAAAASFYSGDRYNHHEDCEPVVVVKEVDEDRDKGILATDEKIAQVIGSEKASE